VTLAALAVLSGPSDKSKAFLLPHNVAAIRTYHRNIEITPTMLYKLTNQAAMDVLRRSLFSVSELIFSKPYLTKCVRAVDFFLNVKSNF